MKKIRMLFGGMFAISAIFSPFAIIIGSFMQGYCKDRMAENPQLSGLFLEQKRFWVQVSETNMFFIIAGIMLGLFLLSLLTLLIKPKARGK